MDKKEFIGTFSATEKERLMDEILGEIYDEVNHTNESPDEVIKRHLKQEVIMAANDSRIIDVFIQENEARLERMKRLDEQSKKQAEFYKNMLDNMMSFPRAN